MDLIRIDQHKLLSDGIQQYISSDDSSEQIEIWFARELQELLGIAKIRKVTAFASSQKNGKNNCFRTATHMIIHAWLSITD